MKILVTGGAGYIGSRQVQMLGQAGHQVRVLDLQPLADECLAVPACEFVQGNLADSASVVRAVQDVDVVYHLAWGFYPGDERREVQENVAGTLNLLAASRAAGVRHFVFVSSAVVYGPTGPGRVDEEHACHPERSTIGGPVYGITKLACEKYCLVYHRRGLNVTVFRLHGVFSGERLGQFGHMLECAQAGQPVKPIQGAGGEYAHLADVLRIFPLAMANPKAYGEVFNVAGVVTYRDSEVAHFIVEQVGAGSRIELVEDRAQEMVSVSVDKLSQLLGYKPERGEFLTQLIASALGKHRANRKE
jgi:UDP-glucose 4-epimerase